MENVLRIRQNIFVIRQLAHREKCRENAATNLGQVWQIVNPFLNMMILVILFSTVFKNDNFVNYPLYVCTGTVIYDYFVRGTNGCLTSLIVNKQFLIKTTLKKDIFVLEELYVAMVNLFFSGCIYLGMMLYYRVPLRIVNLLVFLDILLFSFFILGIGKILAVINVFFADIKYFYQIFTLFVFYGTAIFYKPERLTPPLQVVMSLNPVYVAIAIARQLLIDGIIPSIHLWIKLSVYALFIYICGVFIFRKGSQNVVANL